MHTGPFISFLPLVLSSAARTGLTYSKYYVKMIKRHTKRQSGKSDKTRKTEECNEAEGEETEECT
jgi:hypothetical protein